MTRRQRLFTPVVLAILAGAVGGLVRGGTPALANTLLIPTSGTVDTGEGTTDTTYGTTDTVSATTGEEPEAVSLSGNVEITSTLVPIEAPGTPRDVVLHIRLVDVTGLGRSGTKYVAPGENILVRPLVATERLQLRFPFFPSGSGGSARARSALVSLTLDFDVTTGMLTAATGDITNP